MPLFNLTDAPHYRQAYFGKTAGRRVPASRRQRGLLIGMLFIFIAPLQARLAEHDWSQASRPRGQAMSKDQYPPPLQDSSDSRLMVTLPGSLSPVPPSSKVTLADRAEGDANRPELVLQVGHNDIINSLAFSPDGRILATASQDNTVKLWNVSTGHMLRTLSGHTSQVTAAAFSPDGQWLVSASHDMLYRWEVATGRMTQMGAHNFGITVIAFNPKGRWFATGNIYSLVRLRDITTGHETATIVGHESLPAGTEILHSMGKNRAILGSIDILVPVFSTVMHLLKDIVREGDEEVSKHVFETLRSLFATDSPLVSLPINIAYCLRVLAYDPSIESGQLLVSIYNRTESPSLRRDIINIMTHREATYWLSDRRKFYEISTQWEKRALLIASFILGDEGAHWRRAIQNGLNGYDQILRNWARQRKQDNKKGLPL